MTRYLAGPHTTGTARRRAFAGAVCIAAALAWCAPASAVTADVDIGAPAGPLVHVYIGQDVSCQISHTGDSSFEMFPPGGHPGDCGTFLSAGGTLYTPDFANHSSPGATTFGTHTPFTFVSQSPVSGSGSASSPFRVVTTVDATPSGGAAVARLTETDSYVIGDESYRTDVMVANRSSATLTGFIYAAGDCYLQNSDTGFGFLGPQAGAVGCSANANNSPAARIEQWVPLASGNNYYEDKYDNVWGAISGQMPFANSCQCTSNLDNGAGLQWPVSIPAGGQVTLSHYTTFSPTGNTAPPPSTQPSGATPSAFGPNGAFRVPSNRACLSKRVFTIHVRRHAGVTYQQVTVFLNSRSVRVVRGTRASAAISLRGLPKGRFVVKIIAITTSGAVISGTRAYHTCLGKRLRGGRHRL